MVEITRRRFCTRTEGRVEFLLVAGEIRERTFVNNELTVSQALTGSGVWCNWQHNGFWYRHSRFESWYPSSQKLW